ncbi:MAG: hypothetical protein WAO20_20325 [Acidobacteriota bacterium]
MLASPKRAVWIFGCGSAGRRAFQSLSAQENVAGFFDNNQNLHGTTLFELPVRAPSEAVEVGCELIVIASMFHREIRAQLVDGLGIDPRRVTLAPEFVGAVQGHSHERALATEPRRTGLPADENDRRLRRLRNRHQGQRGFVIGNGPSLRMEDLDRLHARGEICLASNKIFLAFGHTAWRPAYYGVEDKDIARRSSEEIDRLLDCPCLTADYLVEYLPPTPQRVYFRLLSRVQPPDRPAFSENLLHGINCGGTITYTLLQLAAWLGLREVYLLGVDFSYDLGVVREHRDFKGFKEYSHLEGQRKNYFSPDYFKPGEYNVAPDLPASLCAYESARQFCHERGRMLIRNATRGGKLEVFERSDIDRLLS